MNNVASKSENPCQAQAIESYKCQEANQNNKDVCQPFFDRYKECRRRWTEYQKQLKQQQQQR
jgi:cytochrome c oxidase assembly protein subunit 23